MRALLATTLLSLVFPPNICAGELIYTADGESQEDFPVLLSGYDLYKKLPSRKAPQIERKEFVVDSKVSLVFCSHRIEKGEWLVKILRKYGYRNPYSIDLTPVAVEKNDYLNDPDLITEGDFLSIPILYYSEMEKGDIENGVPCDELLGRHSNEGAFIVQGPEARSDVEGETIVFYSGVSSQALRRNEKGIYRRLTIADRSATDEDDFNQYESNLLGDQQIDDQQELGDFKYLSGAEETEGLVSRKKISHEFAVFGGGSFDSIHSKDDETLFISELQPISGFKWKQHWTSNWKSFVAADIAFRSYVDSASPDQNFRDRKVTPMSIFFGVGYIWWESLFLEVSAGLSEQLYYQQISEKVYSIIKDPAPFVGAQIFQRIAHKGGLSLSGFVQVYNYFPGRQDYRGGIDYGLGFETKHRFSNGSSMSARLLYHQGDFKSSWARFEQRWLDLKLAYSFLVGL